jgi:hypothetical protein
MQGIKNGTIVEINKWGIKNGLYSRSGISKTEISRVS